MLKTLAKDNDLYDFAETLIICPFDYERFIQNIMNNLCKFSNIAQRSHTKD